MDSAHRPPDYVQVPDYMEELISFINHADSHKYDLLKTAAAHHRFAWIHPFHNGNGRVVRLLTYAMLIKQGFNIKRGRIINPTAVFCINRNNYYAMLSQADSGSEGMLAWCEYVLHGLYEEIIKIDKLTDYSFLAEKILIPAVEFCCERGSLNKQERDILKVAVTKVVFQSADIEHLMPGKIPAERSRVLARLRNEGLIEPLEEKARKYMANFTGSCLLRGVIKVLMKENFTAMRD
ncbi:MAG: Fic/DOC family protein [Candidatus Electronema aureum]|uniref:Fic/DOC family protein n=1 Tax=Candidatus Electronema aureum TaxID=2005002 RepID=A0A521G2Y7_9BACT|nr:MAG: Fic/DOC family protein [Candidatus Electronema aureum]